MFKNEASILEPFCDQINEFFDLPIFIDHSSEDESLSIIKRKLPYAKIFKLISRGYPQSQLANLFAKMAFDNDASFLFFLDCDEYLPFNNRTELEQTLQKQAGDGYLYFNWRNIVPLNLNGNDPFSDGFITLPYTSKFTKVAISHELYRSHPNLTVTQGYHTIIGTSSITPIKISPLGLLHIPVPFREKYIQKMSVFSSAIREDKFLSENQLGTHWIKHDDFIKQQNPTDDDIRRIGLLYPKINIKTYPPTIPLDFRFPYVKSKFAPEKLVQQQRSQNDDAPSHEFTILDESSHTMFELKGREFRAMQHYPNKTDASTSSVFDPCDIQDRYIAPLFSLPRMLPPTAWHGHIPFLFVLFRNLKPARYVDLGVHLGASLIAAATAAQAYDVKGELWGIDTWLGDDHAGHYQGDKIYDDLHSYLKRNFPNTHLVRSTFNDAVGEFKERPIDLLHIDGLHTYEAVKNDFESWLPTLSNQGVVIFHDISVRDRGFGVWRLWAELKRAYPFLEFTHCYGLGVLFVGANSLEDPHLKRLVDDPALFDAYRATVSQIAELLPLRSAFLAPDPAVNSALTTADFPTTSISEDENTTAKRLNEAQWALQYYKNQLQTIQHTYESSMSWKITAPLRYMKAQLLGKNRK